MEVQVLATYLTSTFTVFPRLRPIYFGLRRGKRGFHPLGLKVSGIGNFQKFGTVQVEEAL
jgi:hypothetical protein